ncbi:ferredoxin reductase family protein [Nakamurella sp. A5-74]|uniref:Ferredoxin reductase family protein n=1 Tax=Nakamurella sp. A5-74 TaxID=3158264 RepID=A0AAU8DJQ8_9ACTN
MPIVECTGRAGYDDRSPVMRGRRRCSGHSWFRDLTAGSLWLVLVAVTALWLSNAAITDLTGSLGSALTSIACLSGLLASALLLAQVFMMARVPIVEQSWGQDRLAMAHRLIGISSFTLMMVHIVLVTLGYAATGPLGLWGTIVDLVVNYPGILLAVAGTIALLMVVATSARWARRKLKYESWHLLHLYAYVGVGLALPHQLWTGNDFLASRVATVFWWSLYAVCAGPVIVWRIVVPLVRSLRAGVRVVDVRPEGPGAVSVTVSGPGIAALPVQPGQFFQWRFLTRRGWSRANPFSLSAAPDGRSLRFTAAIVGEGTARLTHLRPGTRVLIEGPYGRMHPGVRTQRKVLLMGSGIGIAPMLSLLQGLEQQPGDVMVVHRVRSDAEAALGAETAEVARRAGADYLRVAGRRIDGRASWLPQPAAHLTDVQALLHLCPDVAEREVYLCGAPAWMQAVHRAARAAGVPPDRVHDEQFGY